MSGRLNGKVALVTGGGRGIGEAIVRAFAAEGAHVWVSDLDYRAAGAVAESLEVPASAARLDVRREEDWRAAITAINNSSGRLDVLVNNAGITGLETGSAPHDPEQCTLEDWRSVHRTNLDGVFLGCKHALRAMRPVGRGSIINISSQSGLVGVPRAAAYASSKAGVRNHTKTVALWCASQGLEIRCNSIHPGPVLTPMWNPLLGQGAERDERMAEFAKATPAARFAHPDEIAAVAVLLASDEATFMTGSELVVDGGLMAGPLNL
jgi:NAD(P)-dependent dehydrogenase (short-subunit alcohol dehydrogenase family)